MVNEKDDHNPSCLENWFSSVTFAKHSPSRQLSCSNNVVEKAATILLMPYHAQFEQWIAAPIKTVFAFFADPQNLPRIMPRWLEIRFEELEITPPPGAPAHFAGAGSRFLASYRALPFLPMRILSEARIVGFEMNAFFSDVQVRGPFRSWHHRHEFATEERGGISGTMVRDRIEYEIGFEPLGGLINSLFIVPQMRRTFAYRRREVERLLCSAV